MEVFSMRKLLKYLFSAMCMTMLLSITPVYAETNDTIITDWVDLSEGKVETEDYEDYNEHYFTDEEIYEYFESIGEPIDDIEDVDSIEDIDSIMAVSGASSWFQWIKWINRGGAWSLSIMPFRSKYPLIAANSNAAWSYIYSKHHNSRHWRFYAGSHDVDTSMRKQFDCHVAKANIWKTPWNLEPSKRPEDIGWGCN